MQYQPEACSHSQNHGVQVQLYKRYSIHDHFLPNLIAILHSIL